jgi:hypothetical protein
MSHDKIFFLKSQKINKILKIKNGTKKLKIDFLNNQFYLSMINININISGELDY